MKRMRNSVKAIIISICVAIVAASAIVGIVLLNKKDPTPPGPEPSFNLTQDQKDMLSAITQDAKQEAEDNKSVVEKLDSSKIVDENGDSIDTDLVKASYESCFVVEDGENSYLYLFAEDSQGNAKTINLFETLKSETKMKDYEKVVVNKIHENYVAYSYTYMDGMTEYQAFEVACFADPNNLQVVNKVDFKYQDGYLMYGTKYLIKVEIEFYDDYYLYTLNLCETLTSTTMTYVMNFAVYTTSLVNDDVYTYESSTRSVLTKANCFSLLMDNSIEIIVVENASFVKKVINNNNDEISNMYFLEDGVILVYENKVQNLSQLKATSVYVDKDAGYYADYAYSYFDFNSETFSNISLSSGYSKITSAESYSNGKYIVLREVKVDENHTLTEESFITYYDNSLKKIISYSTDKEVDILYAKDNNVLTSDGIIKFKDSGEYVYVKDFSTETYSYTIASEYINDKYFAITGYQDSFANIMSIEDGSLLFDDAVINEIYDYGNGIFAGYYSGAYYLIDMYADGEKVVKITNFYNDADGLVYNMFVRGMGYYIVENTSETYSLMSVKSSTPIYDNISKVSFNDDDFSFIINAKLSTGDERSLVYIKDNKLYLNYFRKLTTTGVVEPSSLSSNSVCENVSDAVTYDKWYDDEKRDSMTWEGGCIKAEFENSRKSIKITFTDYEYPYENIRIYFENDGSNEYMTIKGLGIDSYGQLKEPTVSFSEDGMNTITGWNPFNYDDRKSEFKRNLKTECYIYEPGTIIVRIKNTGDATFRQMSDNSDDYNGPIRSTDHKLNFTINAYHCDSDSTVYTKKIYYTKYQSGVSNSDILGGKYVGVSKLKTYKITSGYIDQTTVISGNAKATLEHSSYKKDMCYNNAQFTEDDKTRLNWTFHQYNYYSPKKYSITYYLNAPAGVDYQKTCTYPYPTWQSTYKRFSNYEVDTSYTDVYDESNMTAANPKIIALPKINNYKCSFWATNTDITADGVRKFYAGTNVFNTTIYNNEFSLSIALYAIWDPGVVTFNMMYADSSEYAYVLYDLSYNGDTKKWYETNKDGELKEVTFVSNNTDYGAKMAKSYDGRQYILYLRDNMSTVASNATITPGTGYCFMRYEKISFNSDFALYIDDEEEDFKQTFYFYYGPDYAIGGNLLVEANIPTPLKKSGSTFGEDTGGVIAKQWKNCLREDLILVSGTRFEFAGHWAVAHHEAKYSGVNDYVPVSYGSAYFNVSKLGTYFGSNNVSSVDVVAIYAARSYIIDMNTADGEVYGSSNIESENGFKDKSGSNDTNNNLYNATLSNDEEIISSINATGYSPKFYLGGASIDITLCNYLDNPDGPMYYIFDRIEISKIGYYSSGSYGYATLVLTLDADGGWSRSVKDGASTLLGGNDSGFYLGSKVESTRFNIFTLSNTEDPRRVTISVSNLGIPGDGTGSGFKVTKATSTSGKVGFTVTVYAKSNYTPDDSLQILNNASATGDGTALEFSAQPVVMKDSKPNFWINNVQYALPSDTAGYYVYNTSEKKFKTPTASSVPTTTSGWLDNYVYYDKPSGILYYPSSYDTKTGSEVKYKTNSVTNNANFANTKLIAIRPEQNFIYASSGSDSVSSYDDDTYARTYDLTSYLSSIQISLKSGGATTQDFILERTTNNSNGVYKSYIDYNLKTPGATNSFDYVNLDDNENVNIRYLGVNYKIYQYYRFSAGSSNTRYFVLYVTRNETNREVMYFLYSDVLSTSIKYNSTHSNAADIVFTFKKFDKSVSLTLNDNDDVFDDNDNSIVYRYSYKDEGTLAANNMSYGISSSLNKQSSSSSPTSVSYFENNYYTIGGTVDYKMNPSDFVIFELQPTDGYVIKKFEVTVGGDTLFKYDYVQSMIDRSDDGYYTYTFVDSSLDNANETRFQYKGYTTNRYFKTFESTDGFKNYAGVMFVNSHTNSNSRSNVWKSAAYTGNAYFNPVWLMVSGMYEDVSISVETISYAEFYFVESIEAGSTDTELLGTSNLDKLTMLVDSNEDGTWEKIDFTNTTDGISIKTNGARNYRVIFEGEADLFKKGIKIYSTSDGYSNYFTQAKLYLDETKSGSAYTGRLFENIKYSLADDVVGRTESDGSLYVDALTTDAGVVNGTLNLNSKVISYNDKATYIYISDIRRISYHGTNANSYITGTYSKSSRNYYSGTYNSVQTMSNNLEYNNKYFMAFTVKKNAVEYTTSSYLYNDNITKGDRGFESEIVTNPSKKSVKVYGGKDIKSGMVALILTKDGEVKSSYLSVISATYSEAEDTTTVTFAGETGFNVNTLSARGYKLQYTNYQFISTNVTGNVMQYYSSPNKTIEWKYLSDTGFRAYQLDYVGKISGTEYTKAGSWFNDVVLTNYKFYNYTGTNYFWQTGVKTALGEFDNDFNANGYSLNFEYYETPGYYLNYIEIDTVDFGKVYINVPTIRSAYTGTYTTLKGKLFKDSSYDLSYYYKLSYNSTSGMFTLELYDSAGSVTSGANSLGILSNNFAVNFYSYPYSFNINFQDNTGNSSSDDATLKRYYSNGSEKTDSIPQTILYDSITYLDLYLDMKGYTFVGWASQKYYSSAGSSYDRYDAVTNTWNTTSSWIPVESWFSYDNRSTLLTYKQADTKFYSSDFYVKSSFIAETNEVSPVSTGYFITDTGFANSTAAKPQNYNFWSVYARQFVSTIGGYNPNSPNKGNFNLYAIWKANTYSLQFNVYDTSVNNGSTEYKLDIKAKATEDKSTPKMYDDAFTNNGLSFNISHVDGAIATGSTTYYCFIRFDTNDWYITDADVSNINTLFSYYNEAAGCVNNKWNTVLDSTNKINLVIDRYGYSWLGWFSKNETDIRVKSDVQKDYRIFGSDYYFGDYDLKDYNSQKYTMDYTTYRMFELNGTLNETYSKFVYNGQHKVDSSLGESATGYVYFYNYKTTTQVYVSKTYYVNKDYLNIFEATNGQLTCFDTTLSYDCYSYSGGAVEIMRSLEYGSPAIRYLKLYAYWQVNYYQFIIDWQDNTGNVSNSLNVLGSTTAGILDGTEVVKESFDGAYFDDNELSNRLNNFTPVRVGYDFLGWAYYYRTASGAVQLIPVYEEPDKADTALWLNRQLTTDYGNDENGNPIVPLYTSQECIKNISFKTSQETFGQETNNHYCYLFAIWKPQTFTINVDLNIDREELENLYEKDSNFVVALYKNILSNINIRTGIDYENYTGIRTNYYKLDTNTYTEIVANLNFVIEFDQDFTTAYCEIPYKENGTLYKDVFYLDNLFAVSTGYYLLGWLFDPNLAYGEDYSSRMLIYNTLKSTFGIFGDMTAGGTQVQVDNINYADGESYLSEYTNVTFNFDMYKKLYNTDYKERPAGSTEKFYTSNETKLTQEDAHGASSNFGYIEIAGQKAYIACDDDVDPGQHALFFKYNGLKYYLVLYYYKGDTVKILTNDHSFLYCDVDGVKYKIRFDTFGQAYYVDTYYGTSSSTDKRVILDIRAAAFQTYSRAKLNYDTDGVATNGNISTIYNVLSYNGEMAKNYMFYYNGKSDTDHYYNYVKFVPCTTRQFTLYAHWQNKNDMYVDIKNGNNSDTASHSNPGLAGYYNIITSTTDRVLGTYTSSFVDNANVLSQSNTEPNLRQGYNYYDDIAINILPYYNGRFLSELSLTFYGVSEKVLSVNDDSGKMKSNFVTSKYTLTFKFEWDNEKHIIKFRTEGGVVYKVDGADGRSYSYILSDSNGTYFALESMALGGSPISQLSLLDADVFSDYLFRVFEYSNGSGDSANFDDKNGTYGRWDTNKISINMENLMTSMDITCKFSVQTYDLKFYSILDAEGYRLNLQAGTTNKYETGFNTYDDFQTNVTTNNSNANESGTFFSSSAFGSTNLATIPQDCAAAPDLTQAQGFNVPYGYFIYGQYYTSAFAPNRPIDSVDPSNNVVELLNTDMYGFEYIYSNGYFEYGQTGYDLAANPTDATDSFYAQCSPVLGPTYKFSQANGFRKLGLSFYTFSGWYEYDKTQTSKVVFVEYDRLSEATYIKRNIVLYGYYYPINTPTSIEFYTWNDENKNYIQYTGNANQYTLNAEVENHPFYQQSNLLVWNTNNADYIDANNIAKIKTYNKYGVNSTKFGNDKLSVNDFQDQAASLDAQILERVLQTYWFYDDSYMALYFMSGSTKHYIRYDSTIGFYYLTNENNPSSVYKVDIYTDDMENFKINGTNTELETEELYKYDFDGSYLYIKETANMNITGDKDKYYRLHEVTQDMMTKANNGTYGTAAQNKFLRDYEPRYYYDMHGTRYYMLARNEQGISRASNTIYYLNNAGSVVVEQTANLTTVKNYFIQYGGEYYPVDYTVYADERGSTYISPMHNPTTNTVTIPTGSGPVECYFNYDTKLLYNKETSERVDFDHYVYCPINENYLVNTKCISGIWYTDAITIKSLPSPNIGFWYDGDNYGFVGYIMVTDKIIEDMKKAPSNDGTDKGGVIFQSFDRYMKLVYSKANFAKTRFSDYNSTTGQSALYDEFITRYAGAGGSFDDAYNAFYNELSGLVGELISRYSKTDLLSSLLLAESYEYSKDGIANIISGVNVNIPVSFKDITIDPRTGRNLSMTVTVQTEEPFSMISINTSVETNIYAIPIYSPYLVQFNDTSVEKTGDRSMVVDIEKMDVWHFELGSDSSYAYNKANGDFLNFILLNSTQYQELYANQANISEYMSTIIKGMSAEDKAKFIFTESSEVAATNTVDIDLSACDVGHYVLVAYYNKTGITAEAESYVVRVSDNLVHIQIGAAGTTYEISTLDTVCNT